MAAPSTPINFNAQSGNGQIYLTWNITAGADSYSIQRSTDGVNYIAYDTSVANNFMDEAPSLNTLYYYKVAALQGADASPFSNAVQAIATMPGIECLASLRLQAQQRADRVNSNFVTMPEWNKYINQSALELYDILITSYEDYKMATEFVFQTNGNQQAYTLPNGIIEDFYGNVGRPFYKLLGVDMGISNQNNARVTVHKFDFIERNRYVYPNIAASAFGAYNLKYRVMDDTIRFIPIPSGSQFITLWYMPRQREMLRDTDTIDGVSGWTEYVIVDAAIKALQKEESDVSVLYAQKQALIDRIQAAAMNRDAGQPDTISATRGNNSGNFGWGNGDGFGGGY